MTSDANYNYFEFGNLSSIVTNATLTFISPVPISIEILTIGGGGGGGSGNCAGGGGGGIVETKITNLKTDTLTISSGSRGQTKVGSGTNSSGYNSTVNFTINSTKNIIARGGGAGAPATPGYSYSGGSGGGSAGSIVGTAIPGNGGTSFGNNGGLAVGYGYGGGGGAGSVGSKGTTIGGGAGGNGLAPTNIIENIALNYTTLYSAGGAGDGYTIHNNANNGLGYGNIGSGAAGSGGNNPCNGTVIIAIPKTLRIIP